MSFDIDLYHSIPFDTSIMIKICFHAGFYPGQLLMIVPLPWTTAHYCHRTEIVLKNQNKQIGFSVETIHPFQEAFSDH